MPCREWKMDEQDLIKPDINRKSLVVEINKNFPYKKTEAASVVEFLFMQHMSNSCPSLNPSQRIL